MTVTDIDMKKTFYSLSLVGGLLVWSWGALAHEETIQVSSSGDGQASVQIETHSSGNANVDTKINLQANDTVIKVNNDEITVEQPGTKIEADTNDARVTAPGVSIESTPTGTSISANSAEMSTTTGTRRAVDQTSTSSVEASLSIRAQSQSGTEEVTIDSVNLQTEGEVLIQDSSDVAVYAELATERPGVEAVSVTDSQVSVRYEERGRLFGLFPVTMLGTIEVTETGEVNVRLPWYSALVFGTQKSEIEDQILQAQIDGATRGSNVYVEQALTIEATTGAVVTSQNSTE